MLNIIYLDNSATTRPYDEVNDLVYDINKNYYGNPSSLHKLGIEAERRINSARESIAKSLGVESKQIIFTSGGTEANNLAIRGYLEANPRKGRHIITTAIEHPAVLEVCIQLEGSGYKVDYLDVNREGLISLDDLKSKITSETSLISIITVNNETGAIQPIAEAVRIKNSIAPDAVFHTDAVQAYGKVSLAPAKWGIDLMSVSSHKIHGPKGVGALYISKKARLKPIVYGGGQEGQLRSGTENVSGICGFGLAADITFSRMDESGKKVSELRKLLLDKLSHCSFGYKVLSNENGSSYILNISFESLKAEVLLHHLEERGIYVSTGSACSSRKKKQSHVLTAMGITSSEIDGALRFSFSADNTVEDIHNTVEALQEIIPRIQYGRRRN